MVTERSADGTVLALDNVPLELPIAGAGTRSLAALLDYLIEGVALLVIVVALIVAAATSVLSAGWAIGLGVAGAFVVDLGYFAGAELLSGGRTFGKWALGLRVVTREGGRPGAAPLLVRNAVRHLDLLVGVFVMAGDPLQRRVGDRLAGTLVVHTEANLDAARVVVRRVPKGWGAEQVALVESFLRRAPELDPPRALALARSLIASVERDDPGLLAGVAREGVPPEAVLRSVLEAGQS